jgi:hypothetical protein
VTIASASDFPLWENGDEQPIVAWTGNQRTTLIDVQFGWEDAPTPRAVRLTSASPKDGGPVRVSMGGAEIEDAIDRFASGILHVRLPKAKMERADMRNRSDGRGRKAAKKR